MNIGQAVKRIQQLGDLVEKLIQQSNELRERVIEVEQTVDETNDRVTGLERSVERQEAILAAVAEHHGIDVGAIAPQEPQADANATEVTEGASDSDHDTSESTEGGTDVEPDDTEPTASGSGGVGTNGGQS